MATPGTDAALRRDVRLLGETLGRVLVEQGGPGLLAAEERIRELSRNARFDRQRARAGQARRSGRRTAPRPAGRRAAGVLALLPAREPRRAAPPAPAPTPVRARAAHAARVARRGAGDPRPRRRDATAVARRPRSASRSNSSSPRIRPRRRDAPCSPRSSASTACCSASTTRALPRSGRERIEAALAEEITALWQTDETRTKRPRVVDEIRHGLWFFEQSLFDVGTGARRRLPPQRPGGRLPLRFGSWIGGDQDGNPNAGPGTLEAALARARGLVLRRYPAEVREMARALGVSPTRWSTSRTSCARRSRADERGDAGLRRREIGRADEMSRIGASCG